MTEETKPDVEAQTAPAAAASAPPAAAAPVSSPGEYEEDAGKGLGIANFVLLLVAFISGWITMVIPALGYVYLICTIAAIIIASTVSCGCCCASNLKLNPKVKRWNDAVLVTICIQPVLGIIAIIITYSAGGFTTGYWAIYWITRILSILSIVFAGIFAFGRKCCGNA